MTPAFYFRHLKTLDIILLIVNISVADYAFYKKKIYCCHLKINLTWMLIFNRFLLLRWLKGGKTKVKNGLKSILHIGYQEHKYANYRYRLLKK